MSISNKPTSSRAIWTAAAALVICASFATVAVALSIPVFPFDADGYRSETTIYPIWVWALVLSGFIGGAMSFVATPHALKATAASVAFVVAMPLAGSGIVARKHWDPSFGHGGNYGTGYDSLGQLQSMSILIAAAAIIGGAAALAQLWSTGAFPAQADGWIRGVSICLGLAIVIALPVVIQNRYGGAADLTSWGSFGLIYAGPWGVAIAVSAWLDRPAASAALASVSGCALLAALGPEMTWLVHPNPTGTFAAVLLMPLLVLAARLAPVRGRAATSHP
jgi:hypothetical protein